MCSLRTPRASDYPLAAGEVALYSKADGKKGSKYSGGTTWRSRGVRRGEESRGRGAGLTDRYVTTPDSSLC